MKNSAARDRGYDVEKPKTIIIADHMVAPYKIGTESRFH